MGEAGQEEKTYRFQEGDLALLFDRKGRRYLLRLDAAKSFHTHMGVLPHTAILGQEEGCRLSMEGHRFLAVRPTLADYLQDIPRATQIIYPKDVGAILTYGDIYPGARVLEAGLGSGALTLALLRAVGPTGHVTSYETHAERVERALANIKAMASEPLNLTVQVADVYQGIAQRDLDRIVLDVPEPWQALAPAGEALRPGGILLCYVPTALQLYRTGLALAQHPLFDLVESFELLLRPWHVAGRSVRPVHRMVAHTGFITTARKCAPGKLVLPSEQEPWEEPGGRGEGKP
ncbi:MAG: tRNA (adenine-N1)-methyltransferase [Chloroflexi bacterium]|nr:tRNA (adenine-N1)-methyltransferase [Chloroflexota bacterium]